MDRTPPKDLPSDKLIFANQADGVLTLTYEQISKMGIPTIEAGSSTLGLSGGGPAPQSWL